MTYKPFDIVVIPFPFTDSKDSAVSYPGYNQTPDNKKVAHEQKHI